MKKIYLVTMVILFDDGNKNMAPITSFDSLDAALDWVSERNDTRWCCDLYSKFYFCTPIALHLSL